MLSGRKKFLINSTGSSMKPLILTGDRVRIKKTNYLKLKLNDILVIYLKNKIVAHRLIYKTPNFYITKGDNNIKSDGKIFSKQLIGRVHQLNRKHNKIELDNLYFFQSSVYFQEIVKINKLLEKEKAGYVFLKGLPLHLYYEKSHPRRIYADCDILIDPGDYQIAGRIMKKQGYSKAESEYSPIHKLLKDKPTEVSFYKKINNFPVVFDIHLEPVFLMNQIGRLEALYPQKLLDRLTNKFLDEKRTVRIQNENLPILSDANLIIYLGLHFFHHNFRGVFRLELLDRVIRGALQNPSPRRNPPLTLRIPSEVYSAMVETVRIYRLQNFVYPVFLMLKKYFKTPLPREFMLKIKENTKGKKFIGAILKTNIFDGESRIDEGINRFRNIFILSPEPFVKKVFIFLNPAVLYSVLWILLRKIRRR